MLYMVLTMMQGWLISYLEVYGIHTIHCIKTEQCKVLYAHFYELKR